MSSKIKCFFSWSGGKDSSLALYKVLQNPMYEICCLVTTVNNNVNRISMHGVREELLIKQAESIGIPLYQIRLPEMPDMETYDGAMHQHYESFKQNGITHAIYGDIFLQDLKNYRDERLAEAGLTGIYPLWHSDTSVLINEFLSLGFKTIIACTKSNLGQFAGREITYKLIDELPADVDVCGENGEYHTYAYAGPIFKQPISIKQGEIIFKEFKASVTTDKVHSKSAEDSVVGFWYCDLLPA